MSWDVNSASAKITFDVQYDLDESFGALFMIGAFFKAGNASNCKHGKRFWRVFIPNGLLQRVCTVLVSISRQEN